MITASTITCPNCGHRKTETMPTDACQWYYQCESCQELLKPLPGDCCVFCSYGDVLCPPVQVRGCCSRRDDDKDTVLVGIDLRTGDTS